MILPELGVMWQIVYLDDGGEASVVVLAESEIETAVGAFRRLAERRHDIVSAVRLGNWINGR